MNTEVSLVPLGAEHAEAYHRAFTQEVTRFQFAEPFRDAAACAAYIGGLQRQTAGGLGRAYAILSGGTFAGSTEAHGLWTPVPELGIWLAEGFRGQGIAEAALRLVLTELRGLGFTRFFYETDERNAAAIRLVTRFRCGKAGGPSEEIVTPGGKTLRLIRYTIF